MSDGTDGDMEQVRCSDCGRARNVIHTVKAGTPAGDYLGLVNSSTAGVCNRCWNRIPETITRNTDFGLLEFEGWERKTTVNESRFISATWRFETHTIILDAVGNGEWTVSWFCENGTSGETDDWHSRYEARQLAVDQIQRMVRLIKSDTVPVSGCAESEYQEDEDIKDSSASSCEQCESTEGTHWVVQAGTPAGEHLDLSGSETVKLCDECMQAVAKNVRGVADAEDALKMGGDDL